MIEQKHKGIKVSTKRIRQFIMRTHIWDTLSCNLIAATENLKTAKTEYLNAKKNAELWRDEHLQMLAEAQAALHGTDVETEVKLLTQQSRQKTQATRIKAARNKLRAGGVMKLRTVDADGTITELHATPKIEEAIFEENGGHFLSWRQLLRCNLLSSKTLDILPILPPLKLS